MLFETQRSIDRNYIYTQTDENLSFVAHVHNSYEFITVLDGEIECSVYHDKYILTPGKAMLILPNHVHSYVTKDFSRSFLCVFSSDFVSDFYNEIKGGIWQSGRGVFSIFDFADNGEIRLLNDKKTNRFMLNAVLYSFCGRAYNEMPKYNSTAHGGGGGVRMKNLPLNSCTIFNAITTRRLT